MPRFYHIGEALLSIELGNRQLTPFADWWACHPLRNGAEAVPYGKLEVGAEAGDGFQ